MNYREIKEETKEILVGNRFMLFLALFITSLLTSALGATGIGIILAPVFTAGSFYLIKNLFREKEVNFNFIFEFFKDLNHAIKLVGVVFLTFIYVFIGTILLVIPGIIFAFQYSQALFIMAENPDIGVFEAMKRSKEMMRGYKFDFFLFHLSFILHIFLIPITLGLYAIYFIPYYQGSIVNYYRHLSGQNLIVQDYEDDDRSDYFQDEFDNPRFD